MKRLKRHKIAGEDVLLRPSTDCVTKNGHGSK